MLNLSLCILYNHPIWHIILRDRIRHLEQSGFEYWTARELMLLLNVSLQRFGEGLAGSVSGNRKNSSSVRFLVGVCTILRLP
jgi:hypothetical protein